MCLTASPCHVLSQYSVQCFPDILASSLKEQHLGLLISKELGTNSFPALGLEEPANTISMEGDGEIIKLAKIIP